MRSSLFTEDILESTSNERMALQNARMLRVNLNGEMMARQGSMVAYQGQVDFSYQGAGGVGKFLKRAITGEGLPLMKVTGQGNVFLAQDASEIHIITLEGDAVTVNGANVLAFDSSLSWDIKAVGGAGMITGGLFQTVFTGHGQLAIFAHGTPVVLNVDSPTFADTNAAVAWSSHLQTSLRRTAGVGALIGRGSGEAFQIGFEGQGFVIVQASEGPVVYPHGDESHTGGSGGGGGLSFFS